MTSIPDIVGLVGAATILFAYLLLQIGRTDSNGFLYTIMNLVGSAMILFSLVFDFNLPSLFIEVAWIAISLIAIV